MKLKLPATILLMLGFVSFIFGARAIFEQYSFAEGAEVVQGTVISVGTSGKKNTTDVAVSYVQDGVTRTDRLHLSLFSNPLEFSEGESLILRVASDPERNPEAYRGLQDAIMYYVAGIFFMLLGFVFAMFSILIQKFGKG